MPKDREDLVRVHAELKKQAKGRVIVLPAQAPPEVKTPLSALSLEERDAIFNNPHPPIIDGIYLLSPRPEKKKKD